MGHRWAPVIYKLKDVSLKAIVDTGSGRARDLTAQVPGSYSTNLQSVIDDRDIDAVIVATPHNSLSPITTAALRSGKHVLCEKPAAIKAEDIKKNIALAKSKDLTYMVGYNHRFHDGFIKARDLVQKGIIGKLIFIRARYGFGGRPGYDKEWRMNRSISGGGHLVDQGVHMIDLAMSFMGEIQKINGLISDKFWKRGIEDNAFVLLKDNKKVTATIHVSLTQWKPLHNFEIYGTKGYLSVEGLGMKYGGDEKLRVGIRADNFEAIKERVIGCNAVADDSLVLELEEFISAI